MSLNRSPSCQTIERLSNIEKDRTDLLQFKGGGYSVNDSVTLLDGRLEGAQAAFVIRDCIGYLWEKSLK